MVQKGRLSVSCYFSYAFLESYCTILTDQGYEFSLTTWQKGSRLTLNATLNIGTQKKTSAGLRSERGRGSGQDSFHWPIDLSKKESQVGLQPM
jgi:hypothetical protein